jgi:hypothetical protein
MSILLPVGLECLSLATISGSSAPTVELRVPMCSVSLVDSKVGLPPDYRRTSDRADVPNDGGAYL